MIDAYCGIGTIGIAASDRAKKVIGVELNEAAVHDARVNVKMNKIQNVDITATTLADLWSMSLRRGTA